MATTLTVDSLKVSASLTLTDTTSYGQLVTAPASFSYKTALAQGTGIKAARYCYVATLTIAASATTSLDLHGGAGTPIKDPLGNDLTFVKIRGIYVALDEAVNLASGVSVGGNANGLANWVGAANDKVMVLSGGAFFLFTNSAAGYAVVGATGDLLDITNLDSVNAATVNVMIVGE